ncbi:hypothetical protein KX729_33180 [Rhizobium sp. XQZ8]|uniref:hypothetical protein n=1 Tax=Rhizobium populisoli TaxID=2859785 RepID=UPI001CA4F95E|nr:hypothetical protein [Rhizobium populisoli]MBW6426200.1 hypothetical protein [Rhizobium populisoli]
MTEGQKIALLLLVMSAGAGGMVLNHYLLGTFRMGSRTGTIGIIATFSALLLGAIASSIYRDELRPFIELFR